jgi:hypothetical protein
MVTIPNRGYLTTDGQSVRMGLQFAVQSLNGPSRTEPVTILYCLIWDSPNLEGQVPVFISPRKRVAQLYPRTLGSLYAISYDLQGYGGGILTLPVYIYILQEQDGPVKVTLRPTASQSVCLGAWCLVRSALKGFHPNEFQSDIRRTTLRWNFLCYHWEGCTWSMQCNVEFGYQLSICSGTKENLDRVGQSQDLPDANWLLANSLALIMRALTLVSICAVFSSPPPFELF